MRSIGVEMTDQCENCHENIDFVGLIWIPLYGPLKDFKLRFDTVKCVEEYKSKYFAYMGDRVGHEGQCTNIVAGEVD